MKDKKYTVIDKNDMQISTNSRLVVWWVRRGYLKRQRRLNKMGAEIEKIKQEMLKRGLIV